MSTKITLCFAAVGALVATTACVQSPPDRLMAPPAFLSTQGDAKPGTGAPALRVIFVDLSLSGLADDAPRWLSAADRKVFARMGFGDSVVVYGVHDHTAESAPLFDASVPALPPDASMDITLAARKALQDAREGGRKGLEAVLRQSARSHSTRLIDSFKRLPKVDGRVTEALYLSDMLESTPELDLERTRITPKNVASLVQVAIDHDRLTRGLLDGVTVSCVLDSPSIGGQANVNDHSALEMFWRLLITSLGGKLADFDSRVR